MLTRYQQEVLVAAQAANLCDECPRVAQALQFDISDGVYDGSEPTEEADTGERLAAYAKQAWAEVTLLTLADLGEKKAEEGCPSTSQDRSKAFICGIEARNNAKTAEWFKEQFRKPPEV